MSTFRRWMIMLCLCLSGGVIYLLPYLREIYYLPMQEALHLTNTQLGILMSVFGVTAMISYFPGGWLADRIGASKTIAWSFIILIISFGVFVVTPGGPSLVFILVVNTVIASIAIFALRGVYFATFEEVGMPLAVTGTAVGVVSVIGFTPDIFIPLAGGALLDRYPGTLGYRYFFLFISGLCFLGLLAALVLMRKYIKKRAC